MKTRRNNLIDICRKASFASIVLGIAIFLIPGMAVAQDFKGSDFCQECHEENYRDWSASGHPYKLMKSEEARHRPIPLPLGTTWDDVSYVIGGYKWKSRYIDTDGYIITVTEDADGNPTPGANQYNYLTGEWVNYHPEDENGTRPYDCGSCHTTHWVENENPEDLSGNQDGLPGMWGTFDAGGVHCEQCHGNGMTMEVDDSAEMCGWCHYRGSSPDDEVNTIPASGGFVKHHEQYNEHLASPHATMKCVTCHNPHKRGEFSIIRECSVCHSDKADSYAKHAMADYAVECKDCHMPYATKSANQLGPFEGDLQTHIFYINTDAEGKMFSEDGTLVALDGEGKAAVTLDFACKRCHATTDMTELAKFAKNFHDPNLEEIGLNPGLTGHWWGGQERKGEGFMLDFSNSNGALVLVASFYTYDSEGNQVWLIANGPVAEGTTADVTVYITEGRKWGADFNPDDGATTEWGVASFDFQSCSAGSVSLLPNEVYLGLGYSELSYNLNRDLLESKIQCPTFVNNPGGTPAPAE